MNNFCPIEDFVTSVAGCLSIQSPIAGSETAKWIQIICFFAIISDTQILLIISPMLIIIITYPPAPKTPFIFAWIWFFFQILTMLCGICVLSFTFTRSNAFSNSMKHMYAGLLFYLQMITANTVNLIWI